MVAPHIAEQHLVPVANVYSTNARWLRVRTTNARWLRVRTANCSSPYMIGSSPVGLW